MRVNKNKTSKNSTR